MIMILRDETFEQIMIEKGELEGKVLTLENNIKATTHANSVLRNHIAYNHDVIRKLKEENKSIKETNKSIKEENKSIKETNKSIKETNKSIKEENKLLHNTIKRNNRTCNSIKETNKSIREENKLLHNTIKRNNRTCDLIIEESELLNEEIEEINELLSKCEIEFFKYLLKVMYSNDARYITKFTVGACDYFVTTGDVMSNEQRDAISKYYIFEKNDIVDGLEYGRKILSSRLASGAQYEITYDDVSEQCWVRQLFED